MKHSHRLLSLSLEGTDLVAVAKPHPGDDALALVRVEPGRARDGIVHLPHAGVVEVRALAVQHPTDGRGLQVAVRLPFFPLVVDEPVGDPEIGALVDDVGAVVDQGSDRSVLVRVARIEAVFDARREERLGRRRGQCCRQGQLTLPTICS